MYLRNDNSTRQSRYICKVSVRIVGTASLADTAIRKWHPFKWVNWCIWAIHTMFLAYANFDPPFQPQHHLSMWSLMFLRIHTHLPKHLTIQMVCLGFQQHHQVVLLCLLKTTVYVILSDCIWLCWNPSLLRNAYYTRHRILYMLFSLIKASTDNLVASLTTLGSLTMVSLSNTCAI